MELPDNKDYFASRHCRLNKSIYGLKQASRCWYFEIGKAFEELGLKKSKADPCIFYKNENKTLLIAAVYVDDLLIYPTTDQKKKS